MTSRLLLYSMYDVAGPDRGPVVRIERMRVALESRCQLSMLSGGRAARIPRLLRWLAKGGLGSIDGIYVEASSSFATPVDLAFLAFARARRKPVGVYFRDAYQLYRGEYPLSRRRQRLLDWLWRISTPILKRVASRRFAPSAGLAAALGLDSPILLPPGVDPGLPFLGAGNAPVVAYVGSLGPGDGVPLLVQAMSGVRERVADASLRIVAPDDPRAILGPLPPWVTWVRAGRDELSGTLRDVRVCVIPRPITPYTNLAVPLKLFDFLAFGKPVVATACSETERILGPTDAGLLVRDAPAPLADAIVRVLTDDALALRLASGARRLAEDPTMSWSARADTVVAGLHGR
ncbi:MAG TPA: glycosyltransferase family 4 protein [Candidatus Eisenbacteria bacterium]|nr:glycosyltransferase family 4 protein [Candidatus Eisenbacteria bacterium]